jgi:predicted RecA/RadA family phage recombinase
LATNYKGEGGKVLIPSAAANVTAGTIVLENGWVGVVQTTVTAGNPYILATEGEYEIDFITSSVQGDFVALDASSGALSRATAIPETSDDKRIVAKVTAVPGTPGTHGTYPASGKMWVKMLDTAQFGPFLRPAA